MKSGVYKIVNILNGKSYVGSASNIQARWRMSDIRKGMVFSNEHRENLKLSGTLFAKGHAPWNRGKALSEEHKAKLVSSGTLMQKGNTPWNKRT